MTTNQKDDVMLQKEIARTFPVYDWIARKEKGVITINLIELYDDYTQWISQTRMDKHFPENFLWFINTMKTPHGTGIPNRLIPELLAWVEKYKEILI